MSTKYFDILVAKEFEIQQNGHTEKRKIWNKVGQAWPSKSPGALNFELFLMPGQRYFLKMRDEAKLDGPTEEAPF